MLYVLCVLCGAVFSFGSGRFVFVSETSYDLALRQSYATCLFILTIILFNRSCMDAVHERARQVARHATLPTVHRC